jgi:spore germination cell wall hydrolase CwlJ-like protein
MSLDQSPPTPLRANARRAYLAFVDASLDFLDQAKLFLWADRAARVRTLVGFAVLIAAAGTIAAVVVLTRYGETAAPPVRTAPARSAIAQDLPDSPLEFTLSPDQLRALSPEDARTVNASIPISMQPNMPATPFTLLATATVDFARATDCLTAAIYYEAAFESPAGQSGVAQVVLNRTRNAAYPATVCGVVFQGSERQTGCQFSFTCDGALARLPDPVRWELARSAAIAALSGAVAPAVGNATHYHADYVSPYWAPKLNKIGQIGAHIFYRWPGSAGLPTAFSRSYAGGEPLIGKLAALLAGGFGYVVEPELETIDPGLGEPLPQLTLAAPLSLPPLEIADLAPQHPSGGDPLDVPEIIPVSARSQSSVMAARDPGRPGAAPAVAPQRANVRIAAPSNW